jgi:phosphatidylglycerol:prolipoprotein diacylglycerol transferase
VIPYIHVPDLKLGPLTLHPFGLLVATGVIVGTALATRRARKRGIDLRKLNSFITWMLVAGFMGGHMFDEIFYHPSELVKRPWSLFFLWEGLSSFGGFLGGLIGCLLWKFFDSSPWLVLGPITIPKFFKRPAAMPIMPLSDLILSVFPVAWIFGRSGCSVVHDHPGAKATADALLAVAYGRGPITEYGPIQLIMGNAPQYDLGLLEMMFTCIIAFFFALTWRRKLPTGSYIVATAFCYAPVRFVMDFFRITDGDTADIRYGTLTFAQYCCVALFLFGGVMAYVVRSNQKKGFDPQEQVLEGHEPSLPPQDPEQPEPKQA